MESVFGHEDSYNGSANGTGETYLQSKWIALIGNPCTGETPDLVNQMIGPVPNGAAAFSQYKISTVCRAMRDVEIHSLEHVLHFSPRNVNNQGFSNRGGWDQQGNKKPKYFPKSSAVTRIVVDEN